MIRSKVLIALVGLFISSTCLAQLSKSFGVGVTSDADQRIFLNYNKATNGNYSFNFRLAQGWDTERLPGGSEIVIDPQSNEPRYQISTITNQTLQSKLMFGPEFQIKKSNFSWGIEGVLGFRSSTSRLSGKFHRFEYLHGDESIPTLYYPHEGMRTPYAYHELFLTTGLQGRIAVQAMASEKIGIKVFGEAGMDYNILVDNSNIRVDDLNNLPQGLRGSLNPQDLWIPRLRLGASITLFGSQK